MAMSMGDIVATMRLDISQFNASLNQVSSGIRGIGSSRDMAGISALSKTFTDVGKSMTKSITVPLAGMGVAAVKMTMDFDSSMSKVQALSGASGAEMEKLTTVARDMGKNTVFSAKESADALGYMALAGWDANQMAAGLEPVLKLAGASGMELARTSDIVTDSLTMFGMEASEATRLTDVLAYTQANSNTDVQQLGDALVYCGSSANAMGYDIEQTSALLGKLADAGIKGSVAGTTLNSMFRDMKAKAKDGAIAIGEQSVSIVDANGNYRSMTDILKDCEKATQGMTQAEKDQAMSAIWGTEALKGINSIMGQGIGTVSQLESELRNCNGTAEEQYNIMQNNLKGSIANLMSSLEDLAITIGNLIIPSLKTFVEGLTKVVDKINEFAQAHPKIAQVGIAIAGLVAAIGPVLLILGTLGTAFTRAFDGAKLLMKGFRFLKTQFLIMKSLILDTLIPALSSLWTFMLANPITLVIAAIAALVAGFIYLWNNVDGFKEFWINAWESIKEACSNAWTSITEWCANAWNSVVQWWQGLPEYFMGLWEQVKTTVSMAWDNILLAIQTACTNIWNFFTVTIPSWITAIGQWFGQLPGLLGTILGTVLGYIVLWGMNTWNYLVTNVPLWINAVVQFFSQLPGKIWTWLVNCVTKMAQWGSQTIAKAVETGSRVVSTVTQFFSQLPGKIWNFLSQAIQKMATWVSNTAQKAVQAGTQVINNVTRFFSQLPGKIWNYLSQAIQKMATWVSQMASKGAQAASQTISRVVSGFASLPRKLMSIGKSALDGLWRGMQSVMGGIKSKVSDFCGNLVGSFKKVLRINSPSKVMRDVVGKGIVEGIEVGMDKEESTAMRMAKGMSGNLVTSISDGFDPDVISDLINPKKPSPLAPILGVVNSDISLGNTDRDNSQQDVKNNSGVNIYLNIDNFNNQRQQDVKELMTEIADVVKGSDIAKRGKR